jgi:hypothetical protein
LNTVESPVDNSNLDPTCSVCGMGGYWVAYDPTTDSQRCVNHIGSTPESLRLAEQENPT